MTGGRSRFGLTSTLSYQLCRARRVIRLIICKSIMSCHHTTTGWVGVDPSHLPGLSPVAVHLTPLWPGLQICPPCSVRSTMSKNAPGGSCAVIRHRWFRGDPLTNRVGVNRLFIAEAWIGRCHRCKFQSKVRPYKRLSTILTGRWEIFPHSLHVGCLWVLSLTPTRFQSSSLHSSSNG